MELRGKSGQEFATVLEAAGSRAVFEVCLQGLDSAFKALQGLDSNALHRSGLGRWPV